MLGHGAQGRQRLGLAPRPGQRQRPCRADRGRHGPVDQLGQGVDADAGQHPGQLALARPDMPVGEDVPGLVLDARRRRHGQAMLSR